MDGVIFATKVGSSGNENKFDVSRKHGIIKTSKGQSRMNGLMLACCYMGFINENKNVIKVPNFVYKIGKLVAMENIVPKLHRESLFSLLSPFSRRMSSNNENMRRRKSERRLIKKMYNGGYHGAGFTGLSGCDGEDGMNGPIDEAFGNPFPEQKLIVEEVTGVGRING
jgi:hypothetical protein